MAQLSNPKSQPPRRGVPQARRAGGRPAQIPGGGAAGQKDNKKTDSPGEGGCLSVPPLPPGKRRLPSRSAAMMGKGFLCGVW